MSTKYEIRCLKCRALGWCRASLVEGNGIEANDDDLLEICEHASNPDFECEGTGEVEYDDA